MKNHNKPKKYDTSKYTPQALTKRGLSDKQLRKLYSSLRREVKDRIRTLTKAGYGDIFEIKSTYAPTLKEVATKPRPDYYLKAKIGEYASFMSNPLTLVRNQKNRKEYKIVQTLQERGYGITMEDLNTFGKYMQLIRELGNEMLYDSDDAVQMYEENKEKKNKLSYKELANSFNEWSIRNRQDKIENLKRLYPNNFEEKLKEYDLL